MSSVWQRAWGAMRGWLGRGRAVPAVPALPAPDDAKESALAYLKSVTGGELVAHWQLGRPAYTDWSTANAIKNGLKASSWVYICVELIARSMASVPLRVQVQAADGTWSWSDLRRPNERLLQDLLDRPNEFMTREAALGLAAQYWLLSGEAYWLKNRGLDPQAPPVECWPYHGDGLIPIASERDWISGYELRVGGVYQSVQPVRDVVPFVTPDPANPLRGLSPLRAGGKVVDSDSAAADFQASSLQNMAVPSGIYSTSAVLSEEQFYDARKKFENRHLGSGNGRRAMFLDGGATFTPVSTSPKELDFVNSRKYTAYEICALYHVPPPVVGLYEHATYNNVDTAFRAFWRDTVMSALGGFVGSLNGALVPDFRALGSQPIRVLADTSGIEVLNLVTPEMATVVETLHRCGVPLAELNRRFGLGLRLEGVETAGQSYVAGDRVMSGVDPSQKAGQRRAA